MQKRYVFWTGPAAVDQVALRLSEAGYKNVFAGTEKVYFFLPTCFELRKEDEVATAQAAVNELYPRANYHVFRLYWGD